MKEKLTIINELLEAGVLVNPEISDEELVKLEKKHFPKKNEEKNGVEENLKQNNELKSKSKSELGTEVKTKTKSKVESESEAESEIKKEAESEVESEVGDGLADKTETETETKTNKTETNKIEQEILKSKDFQRLNSGVKLVRPYVNKQKKLNYLDFVYHLNARFKYLTSLLRTRQELQGVTSLNKLKGKELVDTKISIIGMIKEKNETKNKNIIITLEDTTGETKVLFHTQNEEYYSLARDLVLDEVIGVTGTYKEGIVFGDAIIFPDIPMGKEFKKSPEEEYLVIIGDMHVGSKAFLKEDFEKFLKWINGSLGTDKQKEVSKKVKYIIFTGDQVEGVGIYPGQEEDLLIVDIKEQYKEFLKLIKQIPNHIQLIMIPGNHEPGRIAEPQLPPYKDFAQELYDLPNVLLTTNPSTINIGANKDFSGFDLLLYHGYSFIYYSDQVESIRRAGGQKTSEKIMKFLLQRRHLAPTHASNLYVPNRNRDPLLIEVVPDFFITGHIHRVSFANYKSVTMINGSCWSDITDDQEKRGLEPQPARMPVINLQTREVSIINFYGGRRNKNES